jgi:HlyD family secretion protein
MKSSSHPLNSIARQQAWTPQRQHAWIGGLVLLIVVGAIFWWNLPRERHQIVPSLHQGEPPSAQAMPVRLETAALTILPQWLEVTGTVQAEMEAPIAAKVLGRVQKVLVREGERVHRGQTLVLLDAHDLDAAIVQADANLRAANIGYKSAQVTARMEESQSTARIAEAQAHVTQAEASLLAARAKLELVQAGPRRQEREQAALAVSQAKSNLTLAQSNLNRMASLYQEGAISAQQYDQFKSQYEVARAVYETAQQGKSITEEGSRAEEIRAARESVRQAQAAVQEAQAGLKHAQANALQVDVRRQEIQGAQAQIGRSQAGLQMARITREDAVITSPFDGTVTKRLADPGMMAGPGVPLLKVQGGALRLEAVVPESALTSVKSGAAVPIRFDALRGRSQSGRVVEIAPQGDAGSHTFMVKIELLSTSGAAAGMFGRARFITGVEKRLPVPASAVWEREGLDYLYVADENHTARLRMVTVGDPIGNRIPILSGLNPGERIIVSDPRQIIDGAPVIEEPR